MANILVHDWLRIRSMRVHTVKKVPGNGHSKSPLDEIVKNLFEAKLAINGISCGESLKMLQKVYGESTLSKTRAYEWYRAFKSGRDVMEDLPGSGRTSTSSTEVNIAKLMEMVTENRHLSLREIAGELSVSHESIRTISNDCFVMKRVAARLVPKDLNFFQKLNRVKHKREFKARTEVDSGNCV